MPIHLNEWKLSNDQQDALRALSDVLSTGLDPNVLGICCQLCELGINPESLSILLKELIKTQQSIQLNTFSIKDQYGKTHVLHEQCELPGSLQFLNSLEMSFSSRLFSFSFLGKLRQSLGLYQQSRIPLVPFGRSFSSVKELDPFSFEENYSPTDIPEGEELKEDHPHLNFYTQSPVIDHQETPAHTDALQDYSLKFNNLVSEYEQFKNNGASYSQEDYRPFIKRFLSMRKVSSAVDVLTDIKNAGITPDLSIYMLFFINAINTLKPDELSSIFLKEEYVPSHPLRKAIYYLYKKVLQMCNEDKLELKEEFYFYLATVFFKFKRIRFYRYLMEHLESKNISPPIPLFNSLMCLLSEYPNFYNNVKLMYLTKKTAGSIDGSSTFWYLTSMIKARRFGELKSFMAELHENNEATPRHYENIIHILLNNNLIEEAKSTFEDLKTIPEFYPSKDIYKSFLRYYSYKERNYPMFLKIFNELRSCFPNSVLTSDVYSIYLRSSLLFAPDKMSEVFDTFVEAKLPVDETMTLAVLSVLLNHRHTYETRAYIYALFRSWATIDDSAEMVTDEIFVPIHTYLPKNVVSVLSFMKTNNMSASPLLISLIASSLFHTSNYEAVVALHRSIEKSFYFTMMNQKAYYNHLLISLLKTKEFSMAQRIIQLFLRRRAEILNNYLPKLHQTFSESGLQNIEFSKLLQAKLDYPKLGSTRDSINTTSRNGFIHKKEEVELNDF